MRMLPASLAFTALFAVHVLAGDKPAAPAAPAAGAAHTSPPGSADAAVLNAKREALKKEVGTWTCEGRLQRPEGEVAMTFTGISELTSDGAWVETAKVWKTPAPREQHGFLGWDATAGVYKHIEFTSEGTVVTCTAPDVSSASVTWTCEGPYQGKPAQRRMTTTKKSDTQRETLGELLQADGTWKKLVASTCKKS